MSDWIDIPNDPAHAARERAKARELRKTAWWRAQIDKGICHYCHRKFPPEQLSMDHIVPVARGGRSVRGNVVPCCKECNNKKTYLTPAEIIMEQLEREEKEKAEKKPCNRSGNFSGSAAALPAATPWPRPAPPKYSGSRRPKPSGMK